MSKHTPGPWEVCEDDGRDVSIRPTYGAEGFASAASVNPQLFVAIAKVRLNQDFLPHNAALIAAAPELLEAIKNYIDDVGVEDREQLAALIAKAEGRS